MFTKKIDIYNPDIWIECNNLKNSSKIYQIMKKLNVTHYAYVLCFKKNVYSYEIFKIGQSAPSGSRKNIKEMGERLARQVAHLPGWGEGKPASSHGYDLILSIERNLVENKISNQVLNKDEWAVGIWNLNTYDCLAKANNQSQAEWAEGELTAQYKRLNCGSLPMGNIVDPSNNLSYKNPYVSKMTFEMFFEEG